jgi:hypothetical protein
MSSPVEYNEEPGRRGCESSTKRGTRIASLKTFTAYLETRSISGPVSETMCDLNLIRGFVDYLVNHVISGTSSRNLKPGTVVQYLSGVVNELAFLYPTHELFEDFAADKGTKWYTKMRYAAYNLAVCRCVRDEEETTHA